MLMVISISPVILELIRVRKIITSLIMIIRLKGWANIGSTKLYCMGIANNEAIGS